MNNDNVHIEELIAKHLAGEITTAEEQSLSQWLNESEVNRKYFNSLQKIYNDTAALKELKQVDTDAAWNKLKTKINQQTAENTRGKIRTFDTNYFLRIAAIFILITGLGITMYLKLNSRSESILVTTGNFTKEILLPDSSTVFLNKNSSITYSFSDNQRSIILTGEAFFDVMHDPTQAFIVSAGDLEIADIGTSFNINAKSVDSVEVIVKTGEVLLQAASTKPVNVLQGELSVFKKASHTITKLSINDPNALAYKTKIFVFENASLPAVIQKLNEVYGTDIKLADNLKFCHLTSTFKNEKIESILQIIAETLQLRINKNNSQTVLEGTGCEE